jgi:hypothetical protein
LGPGRIGLGLKPGPGGNFFQLRYGEYFSYKMVSTMQFTLYISLNIVPIARNTAAMWFDKILAAIKEPACSVPVFNLK